MVGAAAGVLLDDGVDGRWVKKVPGTGARTQQLLGHLEDQTGAKPLSDQHRKHLLAAASQLTTDQGIHTLLTRSPAHASLQLECPGHGKDQVHDAHIQKRRAGLERHRHAPAIELQQVVAWINSPLSETVSRSIELGMADYIANGAGCLVAVIMKA